MKFENMFFALECPRCKKKTVRKSDQASFPCCGFSTGLVTMVPEFVIMPFDEELV
jgi:hypothetical protein